MMREVIRSFVFYICMNTIIKLGLYGGEYELKIKKYKKKYGNTFGLSDFSYDFMNGLYGLVGPNGAGKTTLMQIIAGVNNKYEGNIYIDDRVVSNSSPKYVANLGYLPQETALYPEFTVYQMLDYVTCLKTVIKNHKNQIDELLELTNLRDKIDVKCKYLSGGMKRRLGIALALVNNPSVLILDEPTTGIDILERIKFRNIISTLSESRIVIYSTHTVNDIGMIAKELIFLDLGKIILSGEGKSLLDTMVGKVWEREIPYDMYDKFVQMHGYERITNIFPNNNGYHVRFIKNEDTPNLGIQVEPNYEDLVVYTFLEKRQGRTYETVRI